MSTLHPRIALIVKTAGSKNLDINGDTKQRKDTTTQHSQGGSSWPSTYGDLTCVHLGHAAQLIGTSHAHFSAPYAVNEIIPRYWQRQSTRPPVPQRHTLYFEHDEADQFSFPCTSQNSGVWGPIYRSKL